MSTRLSKRNARLLASYPDLAMAPEDKRHQIYRKAVMHPMVLGIVFFLGIFVLPYFLEFLIITLDIPAEASDTESLVKILVLMAIPFCLIFFLLKKILLPVAVRRVLKKQGYFNGHS